VTDESSKGELTDEMSEMNQSASKQQIKEDSQHCVYGIHQEDA
jgi:hypothetical protein